MNLSGVLDTAIVLVAIYFAGAAFVSFVNEFVSGLFRLRGWMLRNGLIGLLANSKEIVADLYAHPLITASGKKPSYLEDRNFSMAFWDALANRLQMSGKSIAAAPDRYMSDIADCVSAIDSQTPGIGKLKGALLSMIAQAEGNYDQLLSVTDAWFNRQMDRVSGWYKRWVQIILLAFGLALAGALQIDTIRIANFLSINEGVRTQLADAISAATKRAATAAPGSSVPSAPTTVGKPPTPAAPATPDARVLADNAKSVVDAIVQANVPINAFIGWSDPSWIHVLGILITAAAFALGAPFWFDVLSKLVNVRMAGAKPSSDPK